MAHPTQAATIAPEEVGSLVFVFSKLCTLPFVPGISLFPFPRGREGSVHTHRSLTLGVALSFCFYHFLFNAHNSNPSLSRSSPVIPVSSADPRLGGTVHRVESSVVWGHLVPSAGMETISTMSEPTDLLLCHHRP